MTDIELRKLCADALGVPVLVSDKGVVFRDEPGVKVFNPLCDDAQALLLVKRFGLALWGKDWAAGEWKWHAEYGDDGADSVLGHGASANRAIVECVAKMQAQKEVA